jgi:hypothetical protein
MTVEGFILGVFVIVTLMVLWGMALDHKIFKRVVIVHLDYKPMYLANHRTKTWTANIWEGQMYTWNRAEFLATAIKGQSMMTVECWQVNRVAMWLHRLVGRPTVNR